MEAGPQKPMKLSAVQYDRHDVLEFFRAGSQFFDNNPGALDTEGVFRISTIESNEIKLFEDFIEEGRLAVGTDPKIIINLMKRLLRDDPNLQIPDAIARPYAEKIVRDEFTANDYVSIIKDLMQSVTHSDLYLAEILYHFNHVAKLSEASRANKMDATNLGIILAPIYRALLLPRAEPRDELSYITKIQNAVANALQQDDFQQPFGKGPDFPYEAFYRNKEVLLTPMVEHTQAVVTEYSKQNRVVSEMLAHNIEQQKKMAARIEALKLSRDIKLSSTEKNQRLTELRGWSKMLEDLKVQYEKIKLEGKTVLTAAVKASSLLSPLRGSCEAASDQIAKSLQQALQEGMSTTPSSSSSSSSSSARTNVDPRTMSSSSYAGYLQRQEEENLSRKHKKEEAEKEEEEKEEKDIPKKPPKRGKEGGK